MTHRVMCTAIRIRLPTDSMTVMKRDEARPRARLKTVSPANRGLLTRETVTPGAEPDGWAKWLEQEGLAATVVLDPSLCDVGRAVVRFRGRRLDTDTRGDERDRFVTEEIVEDIVPGSGPISVTTRVYDINPGEWTVTAEMLPPTRGGKVRNEFLRAATTRNLPPAAWSWRRWSVSPGPAVPVTTCPAPLVKIGRAPGIIPGIWGAMVGLGVLLAVALTAVIIAHDHLSVGRLLLVALIAVVAGTIGAKTWYVVQSPEHRFDGWCIQGFVVGLMLGAIPSLAVTGLPIGVSLDAAAPGIFLAMALGRVGCFFAGCCGGPPTASRWGVWSSDQRVGARRVPTQLMESALTLTIGAVLLVVNLIHRPAIAGALLVAGLAAYTLGRQGLLRLRTLERRFSLAGAVIAVLSAAVLLGGMTALFAWHG